MHTINLSYAIIIQQKSTQFDSFSLSLFDIQTLSFIPNPLKTTHPNNNCIFQIMFKLLFLTLAALSITSSTRQDKPRARKLVPVAGWTLLHFDADTKSKYYQHAAGDHFDHYVYHGEGEVGEVPYDVYSKGKLYKYDKNGDEIADVENYDKLPAEFGPVARPIRNPQQMIKSSQSNIAKLNIRSMPMETYNDLFTDS